MDAWRGPSGFDVRPPRGHELRLRIAVRPGPPVAVQASPVLPERRGRLATGRRHDDYHWPSVQRVVADGRQRRCAELAGPHRNGCARSPRPSICGSTRRLWRAPAPNTYGNAERGILYGPGHVNFDTSLSKRFAAGSRANVEFRWDVFNLFNHPGFQTRTPRSAMRPLAASLPPSWTTEVCSSRSRSISERAREHHVKRTMVAALVGGVCLWAAAPRAWQQPPADLQAERTEYSRRTLSVRLSRQSRDVPRCRATEARKVRFRVSSIDMAGTDRLWHPRPRRKWLVSTTTRFRWMARLSPIPRHEPSSDRASTTARLKCLRASQQ